MASILRGCREQQPTEGVRRANGGETGGYSPTMTTAGTTARGRTVSPSRLSLRTDHR